MKALAQLINTTANTASSVISNAGDTINYTTFAVKVVAVNYAESAMDQLAQDRKNRDSKAISAIKAELGWKE